MPSTYSDQPDDQYSKLTAEVNPILGLVCCGAKIVDGVVVELYWKSANLCGTYGTDYGYAFPNSNGSPDYFESIMGNFIE
jgi:hypothetical protein